MCKRLKMGLAFSKPENCDCGLDRVLSRARALTGDQPASIPPDYYGVPDRLSRRSPYR
jgi:hypothetical protein